MYIYVYIYVYICVRFLEPPPPLVWSTPRPPPCGWVGAVCELTDDATIWHTTPPEAEKTPASRYIRLRPITYWPYKTTRRSKDPSLKVPTLTPYYVHAIQDHQKCYGTERTVLSSFTSAVSRIAPGDKCFVLLVKSPQDDRSGVSPRGNIFFGKGFHLRAGAG